MRKKLKNNKLDWYKLMQMSILIENIVVHKLAKKNMKLYYEIFTEIQNELGKKAIDDYLLVKKKLDSLSAVAEAEEILE